MSRREDPYPIEKGNFIFDDHRNHIDLARERVGARIQMSLDLNLGKRSVFVPFDKDEIVASKQTLDQPLDRLGRVGVAEQGTRLIGNEEGLFHPRFAQSPAYSTFSRRTS